MNWQDLGGALIKAGAPVIGRALGGPLGRMIGDAIGGVLANTLGTEATPDAVDEALKTTPAGELQAKLSAAESEAVARWQALPEIAKAETEAAALVNETMRAELAAGRPWYHWRNLWGYSLLTQCSVASSVFAWGLVHGDMQMMNTLAQHSGMLLAYFGMQAWRAWCRGERQRAGKDRGRDWAGVALGHRSDRESGEAEMIGCSRAPDQAIYDVVLYPRNIGFVFAALVFVVLCAIADGVDRDPSLPPRKEK